MKKLLTILACIALAVQTLAQAQVLTASGGKLLSPYLTAAFASLPLPTGSPIAWVGDSVTNYSDQNDNSCVTVSSIYCSVDPSPTGEYTQAWSQDPRFSRDSWYDTNSFNVPNSLNSSLMGANNGVAGDHLQPVGGYSGCIPRLATLLTMTKAKVIGFECGTNTINSGDTGTTNPPPLSYVTGQLQLAINMVTGTGRWIILEDITPRSDWPIGDPRQTLRNQVNAWIAAQSGTPGVIVAQRSAALSYADGTQNITMFREDGETTLASAVASTDTIIHVASGTNANMPTTGTFPALLDYGLGNQEQVLVTAGAGTTTWTVTRAQEGTAAVAHSSGAIVIAGQIHPNYLGAVAAGNVLLTAIQRVVRPGSVFNQDATVGNLLSSGGFTGTGGTCNATGMSGSAPANLTVTLSTNRGSTTAVCAVSAIDSKHEKLTVTVTPGKVSTSYDALTIVSTAVTSGLGIINAGQWMQSYVHVCTPGSNQFGNIMFYTQAYWTYPTAYITSTGGSIVTYYYPMNMSVSGWCGWLVTAPIKMPYQAVEIRNYINAYFNNSAAGTPTITIDNWITRVVPAPYPAWGLSAPSP